MGWETRGGRLYYYRKRRSGQRVTSKYVLVDIAGWAAVLDLEKRQRRTAEREERAAFRAADLATERAGALGRVLANQALRAAGYRKHKGQWRWKRSA